MHNLIYTQTQTAGTARCVEVWRLKNVSKCGAG